MKSPNKSENKPSAKETLPETEDNTCDLDPTKICDNCFKCLESESDYAAVEIDGIYLNGERII